MKWMVFLIPLALSGCSQSREERREAVKNYFRTPQDAPVSQEPLLAGWMQDRFDYQNQKAATNQ